MDVKDKFRELMKVSNDIALASSSSDNQPNVRIVRFYYDEKDNLLYFLTLKNSQKTSEFEENNKVAYTTVPTNSLQHVKAKGIVTKSKKSVQDLKETFIEKIPSIKMNIEQGEAFMDLYEISFSKVTVTLDQKHVENIEII